MKPSILLTNDDGYESRGLLALRDALSEIAQVVVVAPKNEKSACGHGITISSPLRIEQVGLDYYRVDDGTPSDCVCLAIPMYQKPFDLLISGINHGSNMGEDVLYSGTVAGAIEGTIHNIPSIALSQCIKDRANFGNHDFSLAKKVACHLVELIFKKGFPFVGQRKLLNVNIPQIPFSECKGITITQKGVRLYENNVHLKKDPKGKQYCWLGLNPLKWEERNPELMSDFLAVSRGFVSITPITLDMTSYADLEMLQEWV
ncbi:5'/3'-nucleotidase SurE [Helicobacter bizzozeronii]|uniref:5'/3'-nucleotidase SurE n=1 Tax=Helicobacter bizzozeronii TaxID=56877 RepID=UPI000CEEB054|nr:5'/3'-nucleotidase SurE [Helicobacter bizzozeronii]